MSLRVRAPVPAEIRRGPGGDSMPVADDGYMSRLVKLVPAEAIGPFPFLMDYAQKVSLPTGMPPRLAVYFVAWVLLIIVIVLRMQATREPGKGAQWGAVLISAVAFFIWVHVMNGDFGFELLLNKLAVAAGPEGITRSVLDPEAAARQTKEFRDFVSNVALMAWTTLAPAVYQGEEEPMENN